MRTLYIARHAKSSWADPGMSDHDRPLNERGLHDAPMMAQRFADRNEPVDLLISSTAKRATTTARAFASKLSNAKVHEEPELYLASRRALMAIAEHLPDTAQQAMLFGHNPGLSELVEHLTENGLGELPTCAIVRIDLEVERWSEAARGTGILKWLDAPKGA